MSSRFPRSGNTDFPNEAPFWGAGTMLMGHGTIRHASPLGQVRAGSAIDLAIAAKHRRLGNIGRARECLAFARDARVLLTLPARSEETTMTANPSLPEVCYALHPETGHVVGILNGESGFRDVDPGGHFDRQAFVDRKNRSMGVTPAQREAMIAGSMFGWHVPVADPANFASAS